MKTTRPFQVCFIVLAIVAGGLNSALAKGSSSNSAARHAHPSQNGAKPTQHHNQRASHSQAHHKQMKQGSNKLGHRRAGKLHRNKTGKAYSGSSARKGR